MHLNQREKLLVALGSALGSNCVPCIESILPKARAAEIKDAELQEAVELAEVVRRKPARKVLETARAILTGRPEAEDEGPCPLEEASQPVECADQTEGCCG
ncbi:MAG: carboxymuconolactone decarboxylase family protein [Planctomycetota bacterium]|jgi:4-carboxymuconolactone decarboxylase